MEIYDLPTVIPRGVRHATRYISHHIIHISLISRSILPPKKSLKKTTPPYPSVLTAVSVWFKAPLLHLQQAEGPLNLIFRINVLPTWHRWTTVKFSETKTPRFFKTPFQRVEFLYTKKRHACLKVVIILPCFMLNNKNIQKSYKKGELRLQNEDTPGSKFNK